MLQPAEDQRTTWLPHFQWCPEATRDDRPTFHYTERAGHGLPREPHRMLSRDATRHHYQFFRSRVPSTNLVTDHGKAREVKEYRSGRCEIPYWSDIDSGYYEFDDAGKDVAELQTVTKASLIEFFDVYLIPSSPNFRKLSVHLQSQKMPPTRSREQTATTTISIDSLHSCITSARFVLDYGHVDMEDLKMAASKDINAGMPVDEVLRKLLVDELKAKQEDVEAVMVELAQHTGKNVVIVGPNNGDKPLSNKTIIFKVWSSPKSKCHLPQPPFLSFCFLVFDYYCRFLYTLRYLPQLARCSFCFLYPNFMKYVCLVDEFLPMQSLISGQRTEDQNVGKTPWRIGATIITHPFTKPSAAEIETFTVTGSCWTTRTVRTFFPNLWTFRTASTFWHWRGSSIWGSLSSWSGRGSRIRSVPSSSFGRGSSIRSVSSSSLVAVCTNQI